MSLILERPAFAGPDNNFSATPAFTGGGITMTASGSANTKGAWGVFDASLSNHAYLVWLYTYGWAANTLLMDIGVGGAGVEQAIVSNLIVPRKPNLSQAGGGIFCFPLFIPSGTRVTGRVQSNVASQTVVGVLYTWVGASTPPWRTFAGVDCLGANTATTLATAVTSGATGTEGSWTSVGSTTARQYFALQPCVMTTPADTALNTRSYHLEIGYSSTTLGEWYFGTQSTNTSVGDAMHPLWPMQVFIPSGTQLQMRLECSGSVDALSYGILAFY